MSKMAKYCFASACVLSVSVVSFAHAAEYYSPMQPGISTGVAAGALPPQGLYGLIDSYLQSGTVKNGNGDNTGIKINGANILGQLLYVPGWRFLGANYAMRITQPFNLNTIKASSSLGGTTTGFGMFNTILTPEMLSWNIGGANFIGEGFSVYLPDGDFRHVNDLNGDGGQQESSDSIANHFWTFEPNIAYSYLGGGWNFTLNNTFDFNTKNTITDYQTGDIYYLDYTIAHSFGKLTVGVIGNYIQQFTADTKNGLKVKNTLSSGYGNEYMHASIGPILSYQVGASTLTLRYLYGFAGKNGGNPSFLHFGVDFPIE